MAVAHKGAISFGLVHIPIQMYRTTQDNDLLISYARIRKNVSNIRNIVLIVRKN